MLCTLNKYVKIKHREICRRFNLRGAQELRWTLELANKLGQCHGGSLFSDMNKGHVSPGFKPVLLLAVSL